MQITYAGRTEERVNLLLVGVALNTLLGIVHDSYYVLHLLVHTSEDVCLVVYLEDVTTQGSIYVEVAKLIVIQCEQLGIQGAVVEVLTLQLTSQLTRSSAGYEVIKGHEVHIGTDSTLQLQVVVDVPNGLSSQTEDILS